MIFTLQWPGCTTVRETKTSIMHPNYGVSRANITRHCDLLGKNCLNPIRSFICHVPRGQPCGILLLSTGVGTAGTRSPCPRPHTPTNPPFSWPYNRMNSFRKDYEYSDKDSPRPLHRKRCMCEKRMNLIMRIGAVVYYWV